MGHSCAMPVPLCQHIYTKTSGIFEHPQNEHGYYNSIGTITFKMGESEC